MTVLNSAWVLSSLTAAGDRRLVSVAEFRRWVELTPLMIDDVDAAVADLVSRGFISVSDDGVTLSETVPLTALIATEFLRARR